MTTCEATTTRIFDHTEVVNCEREELHNGDHQAIIESLDEQKPFLNITWSKSGGDESLLKENLWNECDHCGLLIKDVMSSCSFCAQWIAESKRVGKDAYQLIMDGIVFHVAPVNSAQTPDPKEKTYTVIWYDSLRANLVTNRVTRFGEIPAHMLDLFGEDNGTFEAMPSYQGYLVPFGRHIPTDEYEDYLSSLKERKNGDDACGNFIRSYGAEFTCTRPAEHIGEHQQILQGYYKSNPLLYANAVWESGLTVSPVETMAGGTCNMCDLQLVKDEPLCFHCAYWEDRAKGFDENNSIIINHTHYSIRSPGGFGGREFNIEFFDSSRSPITTNRLWTQGAIPEYFWNRIPDTAKFVYPKNEDQESSTYGTPWSELNIF